MSKLGTSKAGPLASQTTPAAGSSSAASASNTATPMQPAPGARAGHDWANEPTKVYHCSGDKYYGETKRGAYMSEADAKAKGFRADHGMACA
jgi:hypothetical protein